MSTTDSNVRTVLVRANARAWGLATGMLFGLAVFIATNVLVIKGGSDVGTHLGRLSRVFPGYEVSLAGSLIGFVYAFVVGYALGRLLAPRRPLELEAGEDNRHQHVRLNGRAWGWGLGGILAALLFITTNALVLQGGSDVGALLHHLDVYLPGYAMSFSGSIVGTGYLFILGWMAGRMVGGIYNLAVERAEG